MKIVHIHWSLKTGGTENMLVDIVNEQILEHEISIIIINESINEDILNSIDKKCKVYFCKRKIGSKNILPIIRLNFYIYTINPDIIHIHAPGIVNFIVSNKIKVRTIHSTLNKSDEFNKYKALYAISDAVRDFTKKQGFESISIPNGINFKHIKTNIKEKPSKTIKIIQVSRLNHIEKGQDILLEAFNIIKKKQIYNNVELYFIGEGTSRQYLENLTKQYNLQSSVHFEGNKSRDYIYNNLCKFNLFVQPSRSEGFGLTIAEAMAAKVPVIVSNIEGPMEVIGNGKYGYYFKTEDVEDLANKIELALNTDNSSMTEKAYNHVTNTYGINITAEHYIKEYRKILK